MKKFLALLLCLTLALTAVFTLASCNKDEGGDDGEEIDLAAGSTQQYFETGNEHGDKFEYEIINGDEIAIIDKGKVLARGTMEELRSGETGSSLEELFLQLTEAEGEDA